MSSKSTILLCDDDDAIRRLVATILAGNGYEFLHASDAPSAVALLKEDAPRLVVLDVNVPGQGGGLGVLAHVRADATLEDVRVLLVSGVAEAYTPGWGRSLGADGHLAKPFEIEGLRSAVAALMADERP